MKQSIKILALSDVHGDIDKVDIGDAEIVIVAGDIGPDPVHDDEFNRLAKSAKHQLKLKVSKDWARAPKTISWFKQHTNVRFYILPGNHDRFAKDRDDRKALKEIWPENVKLIKDAGYVDKSGLTIWGMPWNPPEHRKDIGSKAFAADGDKIRRKCMKITRHFKSLDVLVTHAPPLIKGTEFVPDPEKPNGAWHFSPVLTEMLPVVAPRLLICGHAHTCSHKTCDYQGTTVVNVALKEKHRHNYFKYRARKIWFERNVTIKVEPGDGERH